MNYNVESWLSERGYETMRDAGGLSVIDGKGGTYQLDTSAFSNVDGTLRGTSASILSALSKSGASGPRGFTPLRNTLSAAGASVGYNKLADAPIVNGQMLNKNDSRLIKVGDDYWIEEGYAKSFVPKSFKDPYEKETKSLVSELTNMRFSYDPQSDASLRAAQDEAMLAAKQAANSRGLLGGSTAEIMRQRAAQELVPQYEQMAYARYNADRAGKLETLSTLGALSKNAFSEYESERDAGLSERVFADSVQNTANEEARAQAEMAGDAENRAFQNQLSKVLATGVVDTDAALVLGLPEGTILGDAKNKTFQNQLSKVMATGVVDAEAAAVLGIPEGTVLGDAKNKTFQNELSKVIAMGVVDKNAALVLGLPEGTLTKDQIQFMAKLQASLQGK